MSVLERVKFNESNFCWEWVGCKVNGYGVVRLNYKNLYCHRILYQLYKGEIPNGLEIDHLCRNRKCCNPEHLEAVSRKENLLRGDTFQAKNKAKTHCVRGHEFTPENTYHKPRGRECIMCKKIFNNKTN